MKVGVVIGRIGGEDGVALETEKWIHVLRDLGHDVCVLTGLLEGAIDDVSLLPPLSFDHPDCVEEQAVAFFGKPGDPEAFERDVRRRAAEIDEGLRRWIEAEGVECLLVENASALPCHLAMGLGVRLACEQTAVPTVTHDHDFEWERGDRYATPHDGIRSVIDATFPLRLPTVRHAVINSAARDTLARRYDLDSVVVPNVMDFDAEFAVLDDYNATLRADLGLAEDDRLLFQITRIVRRKGIETAIELVHRLDDPRVKLVITGTARDDDSGYFDELQALTTGRGLDGQVLFAGERFDNQRATTAEGAKVYSLSDAYAHADACTYFSTYEGFGNAFVEAVLARRPILVNDYEPVFGPDIGSKGFDTVTLRDARLTDEAVEEAAAILDDPRRRRRIADHNFELGRRHFSYDNLRRLLGPLFSWAVLLVGMLVVVGCKSDPSETPGDDDDATAVDPLAPTITISSPADGTIGTADSVEVTGTVTGAYDHLRIAGIETVAIGEEFAVEVPIDPGEPFTPLLAEVWGGHGWARDRRTYVRGESTAATAPVQDGLATRLTDDGIDSIQAYVGTLFTADTIAAYIRDTNPLYSGEIVGTPIILDATNASVGGLFLDMDARNEGLVLNGTLTDVTIDLELNADWAGIWTGVVTADACVLETTLVLSAVGGDLHVTAAEPVVSLVGLNMDFAGIWSWIEDGLESLLLDMMQESLAEMISTDVVGLVNDALVGLQTGFTLENVTLGGSFASVQHDERGVNLWLDVNLAFGGAEAPEYRVAVPGDSPTLSGDTTPTGLPYGAQVVLDDDTLNALGVGLHASGLLNQTVEGELPGDIGITLTAGMFMAMFPSMEDVLDDGDPLTLSTFPTVPMIGRAAEGPEDVAHMYIPGFIVNIAGDIDGDGRADPLYEMVVDGRLGVAADPEDGDLAIDADQMEAKLLSCSIGCAADEGQELANLIDVLLGLAIGVMTTDLMNLIEGLTIVPLEGGSCGPSGDHAALYGDLTVD